MYEQRTRSMPSLLMMSRASSLGTLIFNWTLTFQSAVCAASHCFEGSCSKKNIWHVLSQEVCFVKKHLPWGGNDLADIQKIVPQVRNLSNFHAESALGRNFSFEASAILPYQWLRQARQWRSQNLEASWCRTDPEAAWQLPQIAWFLFSLPVFQKRRASKPE